MFSADTLETDGLGNRSYLAGGARAAVVVDPPRDHQIHERLDEVPAGTVRVHCAGGTRAAIAASVLDAGRDVVAIDDGYAAAADAGLALVAPDQH